jgi:hypothetical protein
MLNYIQAPVIQKLERISIMQKGLTIVMSLILLLLGLLGFVAPEFTTQETKNVVSLGDLKIQANEPTQHSIPPIVSGAAIIVGAVLLGSGLYRKQ